MIHTIRTVAVGDQESKIDSPIILYRGDRVGHSKTTKVF